MGVALSLFSRLRGGVHPPGYKGYTEDKAIREIKASSTIFMPLQQHVGTQCLPRVKKGDEVRVGTVIGDSEAYVSAPIHSSVSGKVIQVAPHVHPTFGDVLSVLIENDEKYEIDPSAKAPGTWKDMDAEELRRGIRKAGIVGLGGAAFPTHVKLNPPREFAIDTVILNAVECEPYLTSDYRLLLEQPESLLEGLRIIMKVVGAATGIIAIEDNKPEALKKMREIAPADGFQVASLKTRYPQGRRRSLSTACSAEGCPRAVCPCT